VTPEPFIKLFEDPELGQIAVVIDTDEADNPALFVRFRPQNLGVCTVLLRFASSNSEHNWSAAEQAFAQVNEEWATAMVRQFIAQSFVELH
jgi:hypothetical protein